VVKSQISKLKQLNQVSNLIYEKEVNSRLFMYNGDMSKWSGQDVFRKFEYLLDLMHSENLISDNMYNNLKQCIKHFYNLKCLINVRKIKKTDKEIIFNYFKLTESDIGSTRFIRLIHSWPQGIFQNISSFVHQLEQIFRIKLMDIKNYIQLVHSDDKNENYILNDQVIFNEDLIVKFNYLIPKLFSLNTSLTKDSYSHHISEMVGLQNIKGKLFDNPNKNNFQYILKNKSNKFYR